MYKSFENSIFTNDNREQYNETEKNLQEENNNN